MGTAVNMNGQTKVYPKDNYQTDIIANISLDWLVVFFYGKFKILV